MLLLLRIPCCHELDRHRLLVPLVEAALHQAPHGVALVRVLLEVEPRRVCHVGAGNRRRPAGGDGGRGSWLPIVKVVVIGPVVLARKLKAF